MILDQGEFLGDLPSIPLLAIAGIKINDLAVELSISL